jgi:NAD(P)-dependent dehydrogenase (short-subunit alcohol dehydrogenase family)
VNNASTVPTEVGMRGFLEHAWPDYQAYLDTVVKGAVNCCQAVLPGMVRRGRGRVINIGTTALNEINAHLNPYVTAKGALLGLTRSLAEEFGRHHVTVNLVAPGWVWSADREPGPGDGRVFRDRSPLGDGLVRPRHVADAVAYLASDRAAGITGTPPVAAGQVMLGSADHSRHASRRVLIGGRPRSVRPRRHGRPQPAFAGLLHTSTCSRTIESNGRPHHLPRGGRAPSDFVRR